MEHRRSVKPRIELPEEDELFCVRSAAEFFESKFENMSVITVLKELEHFSVFFKTVKTLVQTLKDDSHLLRVSEEQGVEVTFDVPWRDLEKFQAKPQCSRKLIASTIRKGAEVSLRQLDKEARKEFDIAKSAEI